jgi:anthranilate/para-aminobenzoate synthase component I
MYYKSSGTIARGATPIEDAENIKTLLNSLKASIYI